MSEQRFGVGRFIVAWAWSALANEGPVSAARVQLHASRAPRRSPFAVRQASSSLLVARLSAHTPLPLPLEAMRTYLGAVALVILAVLAVAWQQSLLPWPLPVVAAPPKIAAPVPLPADVPRDAAGLWLGESADDAYDYPRRQVDQGALQALVRAGLFERAQAFFVELQQHFEQDYRTEYWVLGALDAFDTADPALTPALDAWVKRYPKSYAAYAARGAHRTPYRRR